jgi:DNA mismatch repair ATPase MutS
MAQRFISLLYPDADSQAFHENRANLPSISEDVCRELGLNEIFLLKSSSLTEFFTEDADVIRYRQSTIEDLLSIPELLETLSKIHPILDDIRELRRLDDSKVSSAESYLYSITEIELYVSAIETLKTGFESVKDKVRGTAFVSLSDFVHEITESEYYADLNKKLKALAERVNEVKSVTIGVNLDAQMRPEYAGVISVNSEKFKSGKILDKILRLSFKNDAFTCISHLTPMAKGQSENKQEALVGAFNSAIEDVFRSSVRGWRSIVADYVIDNTDFLLRLLPEIEFVSRAADLVRRLRARSGCSVVYPTILPKEEKAFSAEGIYNPRVALAIDGEVVLNDFEFDSEAGLYVLSGPNRGGKSVITVAVGAAQALAQLGLPVPATSLSLSPVTGIFTHFPEGADDTIDKGRLGEECSRLKEIFDSVDEYGMILLDESLSSTGSYEASYIASEILTAFAVLGCRGIFSTHLHELAQSLPEINERSIERGGVRIDTLVAGIEEGQRSFKIHRMKPDGKSYAKDIADKYGLSFESLVGGKQ